MGQIRKGTSVVSTQRMHSTRLLLPAGAVVVPLARESRRAWGVGACMGEHRPDTERCRDTRIPASLCKK